MVTPTSRGRRGPSWVELARSVPVAQVAAAAGLGAGRSNSLAPCPACGAEQRGSTPPDRRGPVGTTRDGFGWRCHRCGAGGDGIALVALAVSGALDAGGCWAQVGEFYERAGLLAPAAEPSGRAGPRPRRAHAERGRSPRNRPPATEVRRVWSACRPVSADAPVASFLRRRGLNAAVVEDRDLVRALPHGLPVPPWARLGRQRWTDGWRCILPAYGPTGVLESLRARWIGPGCPPFGPKSLAPRAGPGSAAGLVLADGLGRLTLQHGARPDILPAGAPLVLVVTEGEPDYLTWATRWADSAGEAPGVLGVWSGSWSAKIGERVAAAADLVVVRTHRDEKGDRYAAEIRASLPAHIRVLRGGQDG